MIYVFINKKGGVGKSTLATSLAVYLHDAGRRVAVLDSDEQLHSARAVKEVEPDIEVAIEFRPNKIPSTIKTLAEQFDDVVADAPGTLGDESRALMVMADVAIFPMEPTVKCLRSTKESIEVLDYARTITGGRPQTAWIVPNKVKRRTRIFREVATRLDSLGLSVSSSSIRDLQAFPEADQQGSVVLRMSPSNSSIRNAQTDLLGFFDQLVELQKLEVVHE